MSDFLFAELERYSSLTEEKMHEILTDSRIPKDLSETMGYSVFAGGKRLRPALVLAANELFSGKDENALPFAAAIEFIHTYSLIHDDLPAMDNDDYRRGRLTSHKKFGDDRAILAGDALQALAFEILLDSCTSSGNIKAARSIAHAAGVFGMVAGQWVDVTLNGKVFDRKTMEYIHENKTAAMIIGAIKAGAQCGGADEKDIDKLTGYADCIGVAFQIIDDILDVEGDEKTLGKATGSDGANHKTTYVTLYGLDGAKEKAKEYTEKAKSLIFCYGEKARFFAELADWLLIRKK